MLGIRGVWRGKALGYGPKMRILDLSVEMAFSNEFLGMVPLPHHYCTTSTWVPDGNLNAEDFSPSSNYLR